ncbi:unnamed protein product [Brachionus calyciflorus]|uniref:Uncharacterized protein n=1 Tax=Brachionus calyciflorus TaxID=104777 RepID=A0A813XZA6_9BILA|nr:unnamed protein product [Brachionus calyciflorus]
MNWYLKIYSILAVLIGIQIHDMICTSSSSLENEIESKTVDQSDKLQTLININKLILKLKQASDAYETEILSEFKESDSKLNGLVQDESLEDSSSDENLESKRSAYLRFGRSPAFLRFGRNQAYLRFGKSLDSLKRNPTYLRFGRRLAENIA